MSNLLLSLLTFVAYGVLAAYFWRAPVRGDGDLLSRGAIRHLVLIPLAMHGYLLVQDIFSGGGIDLGVLHALSLIVWLTRSEEHTSELQSLTNLVCRLLLEKKKKI